MRKAILAYAAGLLLSGSAGSALAQEHPDHPKKDSTPGTAAAAVVEATVTGENICLGCTLKQEGAAAQCSKYGHRHGLKVTSASADGSDLAYMKGWILYYLETDKSQPFIKEHDGETLTLEGKVYTAERVLEVSKQVDSKKAPSEKSEHPEHPKG
jgi:hypothetical protein